MLVADELASGLETVEGETEQEALARVMRGLADPTAKIRQIHFNVWRVKWLEAIDSLNHKVDSAVKVATAITWRGGLPRKNDYRKQVGCRRFGPLTRRTTMICLPKYARRQIAARSAQSAVEDSWPEAFALAKRTKLVAVTKGAVLEARDASRLTGQRVEIRQEEFDDDEDDQVETAAATALPTGPARFDWREKLLFRGIAAFKDTVAGGWHDLPGPARDWPRKFDYEGQGYVYQDLITGPVLTI